MHNARQSSEDYQDGAVSYHLRQESDLTFALLQFLIGGAQLVNRGIGAHHNCVVELISSAPAALEHEMHAIIETVCAAERGYCPQR